ncbi:MAG: hypothetical protein A2821_02925 [Candidatus Magasanikbacteria bacterium RIFCSPHIGHO2_01_FULL_41_23]|uniref:Phosphoribose diphosphate--decaprenyl-phosphate phosphoribosyltransferase n=1 Tax=Candidatus Magasanikbacteria bacterium RIFCSPLOWO2_01_FULL_40_15 TaxID=1798686 RepID=A0A1F6N433_9BACT|nr:MAG: hypothetical protein A2821_02925 [Candidatus Magasanikbacteria bacterium RIFCSPHIGHO2_01_FULL_41_23]OGH67291.1 MAG: hypothetical protein A3C66_00940 [Candidatus Magasanikbacteria bacterium RIFCSPHIGHO2_02_FULL_41_35]OGH76516.1 MAG: hypothetical protein A3F22_00150 [Candidatus Magasanikbacteria bacterium RIFCSPHIGHO2_12_FULL_41_16]OGH78498.1 MAG: hypothetical protein A2983_03205 [Candidatus Magasanikbacteria bacterium RIFCSPLOWO2_01_FULL_40_15]
MPHFSAVIVSLRPKQWLKNSFVLAAVIFVGAFNDPAVVGKALIAAAIFCLASSAVYIVNDIRDAPADRLHPTKKNRPIAAGQISISHAFLLASVLGISALIFGWWLRPQFGLVVAAYIIVQIFYSLWLKKIVIIDVITIALGFVARVVAGAVAISVSFSPWIIFCTFFLTLYLAITKRREELIVVNGTETRTVLADYTSAFLDQMNAIILPLTLVTYTFYTFGSQHSQWLMVTVPVVLYGLFRYQYVSNRTIGNHDGPTDIVWQDRPLQITLILWIMIAAMIIWFFD